MSKLFRTIVLIASLFVGCLPAVAQAAASFGSLEVMGRVKIERKLVKLQRKRFYLFRGGLEDNKNLIERLRKAEILSRECFYDQARASPEFICWLKAQDCDSPYCRKLAEADILGVPEFLTAYQAGIRQFGKRREHIAREWLTSFLPPVLREGFYLRKKSLVDTLLADDRPLQSTMTDTVSIKAVFVDIPVNAESNAAGNKSNAFLVSNLLPLEIGGKSYLWACEVGIGAGKLEKLVLKVPDEGESIKGCEVFVKDLPVCRTAVCKE